jgi:hypothetical protein
MEETNNPALLGMEAALAVGSEPLGVTFDAVIENVGHVNVTAESLGFVNFKELIMKLLIFKLSTGYELNSLLQWIDSKGALNEAGKKFLSFNDESCAAVIDSDDVLLC